MADERQILENLFADLRAEWPQDQFESLFIRPSYFDKLIGKRPCLLIGGRGTGKTTSLRSLRFDGAACGQDVPTRAYLGVYLRFNKNRVRAFGGDGLSTHDWDHAFAHYFNLLACQEMCRLVEWLAGTELGAESPDLAQVSRSFGLASNLVSVSDLSVALEEQIVQLELFVNNPLSATRPLFSMSEAPLKQFVASLERTGNLRAGQTVFCCLDEYENLTEGQQSIINTYVKHSEPPLTYKIGVRRNGLRTHSTIDASDQIVTPDDYAEIDIGTEDFDDFARSVANLRLQRAKEQGVNLPLHIGEFLEGMDFAKEADLLGAHRVAEDVRREIDRAHMTDLVSWCSARPDHEVYFLGFWAAGHQESVVELAKDWMNDPDAWHTRLGNYAYASLFWLSRGRKGARIRKYYCGENAFLCLSSGNIRYFLELIDESIRSFLAAEDGDLPTPLVIAGEAQTDAARTVGRRRLGQLEALSEQGVDIKRLVLAIGKVFFEFARDPSKSPETNAFVLSGAESDRREVEGILRDGVAHLAFEATPRTKATSLAEMRDEEYRIHPIFSAFFEYSYRRKRRVTFNAEDLLLLRANPARAIRNLLGGPDSAGELPSQLQMFAPFYEGKDDQ